ncbi:uncharacterized protein LOC126738794 [Anthonomus grandis grandis]|uniref:uncharacterized protein LOC126738794 n=1 Tax=Anthonomus grandis grandis TaxID=2921223 RepID=UPI00216578DB|nr:uncharacterized protein LOC126738794 [Anthonomus grandis grandis]
MIQMDLVSLILKLSIFGIFLILLYLYATRNFNYWKKRNIKYVEPVPFIGNLGPVIALKTNIGFFLLDMCETLKSDVFGFFAFDTPFLVVTSPKLLKNILVKDFSIFNDRIISTPKNHPILQNAMFLAKGPSWKHVRSKSTPAFTSGKLKGMFLLILKECKLLTDYIENFADLPNVEAKEICAKYSTNVIARCAFAVEANSFKSEDAEFRKIGRLMFDTRLSTAIRQTLCWFSPMLVNTFGISFFEDKCITRLSEIFKEVLHTRMNSNENMSSDLIDVLLESKKKGTELSEDVMVGSAFQFFAAGFETVSSVLSFTLYELTVNPDIQRRLRKEILKHIDENGLTYESLNDMKYLDMCLSEALRKYPTLPFIDRVCNADYKLTDEITIEKGTKIFVPLFGLHYHKELFPDPYKYDPERFADKSLINADNMLYYMPFGEGPRICIGNRFGLMGVKTAIVAILSKFELVKSDRTPELIDFAPEGVLLQSKIGIPITFKHLYTYVSDRKTLEDFVWEIADTLRESRDESFTHVPQKERYIMDLSSLTLKLLFFGLLLILIYLYGTRNLNYWKKRNIKYVKPLPFVGNLGPVLALKKNIGFFLLELCETLKTDVFGFFAFNTPFLIVTSPKLLKKILVKDFNSFTDRIVLGAEGHPIMENFMFLAKGPSWKYVRSKSTPVFTSGRLKNMFLLILKESELMTNYIKKFANLPNIEAKEICARYATNVIARCAFAVEANSFEREDAEFRKIGEMIFDVRISTAIRQSLCWFSPTLVKLFKITILEEKHIRRLTEIFKEVLHTRMNTNENMPSDLIDVMLESKKKGMEMTENIMVGSALQFFVAGFETVSNVLSFMLYELAIHPDIQRRLRKEILEHTDEDGLTYESLNNMKYLDMCVSEGLRKYPTLPFLDRVCNADYKISDKITIEKGTKIFVPLLAMHYNKELFPDPYKFDPERFADKSLINADNMLYYMPFGEGPRICIGNRFGLIGVKTAIAAILSKYELVKSDQTPEPIVYAPESFVLQSTVGIPITFKYL